MGFNAHQMGLFLPWSSFTLKISEKRKITRKRVRLRKLEKNVEQEQPEKTKMSRLKMLKNNNKKKIQRCKSSSSLTSHRSHLKSRDLNLDRCSALKEVLLRLFEFKRVRAFSQFFKKLMTLYNCNLNRHPRWENNFQSCSIVWL